jgi:hypothetical protein
MNIIGAAMNLFLDASQSSSSSSLASLAAGGVSGGGIASLAASLLGASSSSGDSGSDPLSGLISQFADSGLGALLGDGASIAGILA